MYRILSYICNNILYIVCSTITNTRYIHLCCFLFDRFSSTLFLCTQTLTHSFVLYSFDFNIIVFFLHFDHIIECLQFLFVYFITVIVGVVCVCFNDIQMSLNSVHCESLFLSRSSYSIFFFMVKCYNFFSFER